MLNKLTRKISNQFSRISTCHENTSNQFTRVSACHEKTSKQFARAVCHEKT